MQKTTFTLGEAAELLSCHNETLRRAIKDGMLRAARLGREYRISRTDLQAFWTTRGGGELFGEAPQISHPVQILQPPQIPLTQPADPAAGPTIQTNGPRQLSLLAPGGNRP